MYDGIKWNNNKITYALEQTVLFIWTKKTFLTKALEFGMRFCVVGKNAWEFHIFQWKRKKKEKKQIWLNFSGNITLDDSDEMFTMTKIDCMQLEGVFYVSQGHGFSLCSTHCVLCEVDWYISKLVRSKWMARTNVEVLRLQCMCTLIAWHSNRFYNLLNSCQNHNLNVCSNSLFQTFVWRIGKLICFLCSTYQLVKRCNLFVYLSLEQKERKTVIIL